MKRQECKENSLQNKRQETAFDEDLFLSAPESLPNLFHSWYEWCNFSSICKFHLTNKIPARKTSSFFSRTTKSLQTEGSDKNWRQEKLIFKTRSPWKASFGDHHQNHPANDDEERKGMRILHHETLQSIKGMIQRKGMQDFFLMMWTKLDRLRNLYAIQSRLEWGSKTRNRVTGLWSIKLLMMIRHLQEKQWSPGKGCLIRVRKGNNERRDNIKERNIKRCFMTKHTPVCTSSSRPSSCLKNFIHWPELINGLDSDWWWRGRNMRERGVTSCKECNCSLWFFSMIKTLIPNDKRLTVGQSSTHDRNV